MKAPTWEAFVALIDQQLQEKGLPRTIIVRSIMWGSDLGLMPYVNDPPPNDLGAIDITED